MISNVNWFLPNLFLFDEYSFAVCDVLKQLGKDCPLKYSYGNVRCNWSNSFDSYIKLIDKKFLVNIFQTNTEKNITPIFNFSKTKITEEDLHDEISNTILDLCNEYNAILIVASDLLYKYIKEKYADIKIIASVNKSIERFQTVEAQINYNPQEELDFYNNLALTYDKVVIRPEFTEYLQDDFLPNDAEKYIIPINSCCQKNCADFCKCWNILSKDYACNYLHKKHALKKDDIERVVQNSVMLSNKKIEELKTLGFKNYLIKDNKDPLLFIYPLFNNCLFDTQGEFQAISYLLRDKIKEYYLSEQYDNNLQISFFGVILDNVKNKITY